MKKLALQLFFFSVSVGLSYGDVYKLGNLKVSETLSYENQLTTDLSDEDFKSDLKIDLGDILSSKFTDITKVRKSGIANDIYLRGFGRDNINLLIDGSRIYQACPNRMDPPISHISPSYIKEIKVVKGAFDVENAGSLAGLINVITKEPEEGIYGNIGTTLGSYTYSEYYGNINVGNEFIQVLVNTDIKDSKVFKSGEDKYLTEYSIGSSAYKREKINGDFFNYKTIWTKIKFNINEESNLKLSLGYDHLQDTLYPYLKMDAISDITYRTKLDFYNKPIGLNISLYFNKVKHDMSDKFRLSSNMAIGNYDYGMRTIAKSEVEGLKISKTFNTSEFRFKVGIDTFRRYWLADNYITMGGFVDNRGMIPGVSIKNLGFFVKGDRKLNNFILSAGLRYDIFKSKVDKSKFGLNNRNLYSRYYKSFSYKNNDYYLSINLLLKYMIDKKSFLYVGYGHSVRVPDPEERYISLYKPMGKPDWVGNPNLKPTKNNEVDLGVEYHFNLFVVKGDIFYSKLKDYIYLTSIRSLDGTSTATSYNNIEANIYGGTLSILGYITPNLTASLSYSYQKGRKDSGNYKDKDLAEIPPAKIRLSLDYSKSNIFGEIESIYSFSQKSVDTDLKEKPTSSYYTINIKGGYQIGSNIKVNFGINNLFDKLYYSHLSYLRNPFSSGVKIPEPGRFGYINLDISF